MSKPFVGKKLGAWGVWYEDGTEFWLTAQGLPLFASWEAAVRFALDAE